MMSPEESQNLTGMSAPPKRKHRGGKGRGKGKQHHDAAKAHIANAHAAKTPEEASKHLFKALSSLKQAKKSSVQESGDPSTMMQNDAMEAPY